MPDDLEERMRQKIIADIELAQKIVEQALSNKTPPFLIALGCERIARFCKDLGEEERAKKYYYFAMACYAKDEAWLKEAAAAAKLAGSEAHEGLYLRLNKAKEDGDQEEIKSIEDDLWRLNLQLRCE